MLQDFESLSDHIGTLCIKGLYRRTSAGSKMQRTRLSFPTAPTNMVIWNLQVEIIYILDHTNTDKDRLQHRKQ